MSSSMRVPTSAVIALVSAALSVARETFCASAIWPRDLLWSWVRSASCDNPKVFAAVVSSSPPRMPKPLPPLPPCPWP